MGRKRSVLVLLLAAPRVARSDEFRSWLAARERDTGHHRAAETPGADANGTEESGEGIVTATPEGEGRRGTDEGR
eukprot:24728-Prorocentrum_lima.AAC.1